MSRTFALPDLGEGLPEAELVQWSVAVGDHILLNQTIAEVETAKAVVELPSPFAGVVRELHAEPGDLIPVGAPVVTVDAGDDSDHPDAVGDGDRPVLSAGAGDAPSEASPTDDDGPLPNLVGYGAEARTDATPRRRRRRGTPGLEIPATRDGSEHTAHERPRSTPPVRKLASDLGVDLADVRGSGPDGLVTREDVEHAASGAQTGPASRARVPGGDGRVIADRLPIRGVRRATAEAMVRSAFTAPHVTTFLTVDATETTAFLARLSAVRSLDGHRIGILAVVARAVCLLLPRHPDLNAHWDEEAGEILRYGSVNLGIAAATERGLVVPNIRAAERLPLVDLADAIAELAQTARSGATTPAAMRGGTFSITNVGVFGVDAGTPILNPGESGILAVGAVRRQPWEHEGAIALRDVLTLAISFDHRVVDGAQGSRFLSELGALLRDPARALMM